MFLRKSRLMKSIFLFTGLILIFGCSNESDKMTEVKETPAKTMENKTLVLYNWEEYIGSKTLENFEKETGIHVQEINFQDEEEMLGAVQSDLKAYDLVVASDDLVRQMQEAKILAQLDFSKIPNFQMCMPFFTLMMLL